MLFLRAERTYTWSFKRGFLTVWSNEHVLFFILKFVSVTCESPNNTSDILLIPISTIIWLLCRVNSLDNFFLNNWITNPRNLSCPKWLFIWKRRTRTSGQRWRAPMDVAGWWKSDGCLCVNFQWYPDDKGRTCFSKKMRQDGIYKKQLFLKHQNDAKWSDDRRGNRTFVSATVFRKRQLVFFFCFRLSRSVADENEASIRSSCKPRINSLKYWINKNHFTVSPTNKYLRTIYIHTRQSPNYGALLTTPKDIAVLWLQTKKQLIILTNGLKLMPLFFQTDRPQFDIEGYKK